MRGWWMIGVLALAGCGEHQGWNPNYQFGSTPYGQYRTAREAVVEALWRVAVEDGITA